MDLAAARRFVLTRGTARDRAEVLVVLEGRPPDRDVVRDFLASQNPDGGFGGVGAAVTALVHFEALGLGAEHPDVLERVRGFFLTRQLPDGGWDEQPEDTGPNPPPWETPGDPLARAYLTAAVCLELACPVGGGTQDQAGGGSLSAESARALDRGLDFLLARQRANGRFEGFWHTTWLAVAALAARRGPEHPAVLAGLAALAGHPLEVWEASQVAWMLLSLRRGGVPPAKPPVPALVRRLAAMQRADGSWSSEDGPAYAVFSTVESLRALKTYGALEQPAARR